MTRESGEMLGLRKDFLIGYNIEIKARFLYKILKNTLMVFDVEIEDDGILYECGLMERQANEESYFSVDIRIPGHGDTLNMQLHSLELHLDPFSGQFKFRHNPFDTPPYIIALEPKLNEAIMNVGNRA